MRTVLGLVIVGLSILLVATLGMILWGSLVVAHLLSRLWATLVP